MTDRLPEIVAAANLSPVSPVPLALSSPLIVPALQDQADFLCGMSLNDESVNAAGPIPVASECETVVQPGVIQAPPDQPVQNNVDPSKVITEEAIIGGTTSAPDVKIGGDSEQSSSISANAHESQNDVNQSNESTDTSHQSDVVTNQPSAEAFPIDTPPTSHVEAAPPSSTLPIPATEGQPHPQSLLPTPVDQADHTIQQPKQDAAGLSQPSPTSSTPADAVDIQRLVDDITARASANSPTQPLATESQPSTSPAQSSTNLPQISSSLPPKPPVPQNSAQPSIRYDDLARFQQGGQPSLASSIPPIFASTSDIPNPTAGAPGTAGDVHSNLPSSHYSMNETASSAASKFYYDTTTLPQSQGNDFSFAGQTYDQFLLDEKKYVSEAKWDRFPDGSRLFIGNLSSERASKKEVFDIFGKFGRLAQISLKQAYGFVQYHTLAEGQAAMKNLQGMEIKGRKIHLEYSRPQKKDADDSRQRDNKSRGVGGRREQDRFDNRGRRDDYGRSSSPRRGDHRRTDSYGRDKGYGQGHDGYRTRSRSPPLYDRRGSDRRRSPSPYRRQPPQPELNIPRRYGSDIPDVQLLLLQEVDRNFVSWVQRSLQDLHLKVDVMFLDPRYPHNEVIQRQVVEGVHAVSEIDFRAQSLGKISLQVFDRSAGVNNVRFDQYQDLDPTIAGQLVLRAKSQVAPPPQPAYASHYVPPQAGYPYGAPQHPQIPPQASAPYAGPIPTTAAGLANLDNATLQKLLASIQGQQGGAPPAAGAPGVAYGQPAGYNAPPPAAAPSYAGYGQPTPSAQPPSGGADSNQLVQNIMAQLSHFRQ